MTDPAGLTPEQDAVRRLLADARHDEPAPPEVVARLDETLASLVSERVSARDSDRSSADDRSGVPRAASVLDLGARRRRTVGIGLLAAAAVVVAGVAIGQGLPRMSGGDSDSGSASGGDSATSQREFGASTDDSDAGGGNLAKRQETPQPEEPFLSPGLAGYPELLTFDEALDDQLLELRAAQSQSSATDESAPTASGCELRGIGPGRRVVAQIDGSHGLVVFRPPGRTTQQADLYVCGDPEPVRTLTLPAP